MFVKNSVSYFLFIMSAVFLAQKEVLKLDRKESTKVYHFKCTCEGVDIKKIFFNQSFFQSLIPRRVEAEEFLVQQGRGTLQTRIEEKITEIKNR